jgi:hypothetical protein
MTNCLERLTVSIYIMFYSHLGVDSPSQRGIYLRSSHTDLERGVWYVRGGREKGKFQSGAASSRANVTEERFTRLPIILVGSSRVASLEYLSPLCRRTTLCVIWHISVMIPSSMGRASAMILHAPLRHCQLRLIDPRMTWPQMNPRERREVVQKEVKTRRFGTLKGQSMALLLYTCEHPVCFRMAPRGRGVGPHPIGFLSQRWTDVETAYIQTNYTARERCLRDWSCDLLSSMVEHIEAARCDYSLRVYTRFF